MDGRKVEVYYPSGTESDPILECGKYVCMYVIYILVTVKTLHRNLVESVVLAY